MLLATDASAQRVTADMKAAFDQLIDKRYKVNEPGGAVLIAQNGKILYQRAFGMADIEANTKMQPDMLFNIGSQTKQFTAIRVLQLMEEGETFRNRSDQQIYRPLPLILADYNHRELINA